MSKVRRAEVKLIAEHLRVMHKPAGGVCVLFLETDECAFGISIPQGAEIYVVPVLPARLREIADTIERDGMPLELKREQVPS